MRDPLPPEAREIQGRRAGLASRLLAGGIDYAFGLALTAGVWLAIAGVGFVRRPASFTWPDLAPGAFGLVFLLALVASLTFGWATTGRSVGQRVLGLRLGTREGDRVHPLVALARAVLCALFPIGLLWVAVSAEGLSLHDIVCRTAVSYDWRRRVPSRAPRRPATAASGRGA